MSMGGQAGQQSTMRIAYEGIPRGMGHAVYDRLLKIRETL